MEAFSLLKFWRLNPTDDAVLTTDAPTNLADESDDDTSSDDSFFDLEFTLPGQQRDSPKKDADDSATSDFLESPNNVFCKSEPNSKPQSPIYFLRSPPKFKVLMFLKKPKLEKTTETTAATTPNASPSHSTPNRFAVKCDVDEFPIWSVLNRVNSSRTKLYKKSSDEEDVSKGLLGKGGVQKYLKLIKPPYNVGGVQKRLSDDVKVSDPTSSPAAGQRKEVERKQGSTRTASLGVVGKLGKSRSASSAVGVVPVTASRRDDSLVLQQDGIQGAILHCKKSYNNSSSSKDCSLLSRFAGETSSETSGSSRNSSEDDEKERSSI